LLCGVVNCLEAPSSLGTVVVLLMVAQLGLGYMGRRQGWAAAVHIPNGVLIASLLTAVLASTFIAPRAGLARS
jgi:hypothetical protein